MTLREGETGDVTGDDALDGEGFDAAASASPDRSADAAAFRGAHLRTVDVSFDTTVQPTLGPAIGSTTGPKIGAHRQSDAAAGSGSATATMSSVLPPPPPWATDDPTVGSVIGATNGAEQIGWDGAGVATGVSNDVPPSDGSHTAVVAAVPPGKSRRRWIGRTAIAAGVAFVLGIGAVAVYDNLSRDVVLPGVTVEGREVGGLRVDAARSEIAGIVAQNATKTVTVQVPGEADQPVALADLGLEGDVDRAVDAVRSGDVDGGSSSTLDAVTGPFVRTYHRLTNTPVAVDVPIDYAFPEEKIQAFVAASAGRLDRPAVDAAIDVSTGQFVLNKEQIGRKLNAESASALIRDNADAWATADTQLAAPFPVEVLNPAVTEQSLGTTLFVSRSANKLYHYNGSQLVKSYNVSVGTPDHPTPRGTFKIVEKRKNPTWINPAKGGWGNGMPARIGPGPGNPLGTRAMNLNASGIRIHGTQAVGRLGSAASHGCIRMAMPEVEELFEKVDVNTRVVII